MVAGFGVEPNSAASKAAIPTWATGRMETGYRNGRYTIGFRAQREDFLETRQTGAQPTNRTPISEVQARCTAIVLAGLG